MKEQVESTPVLRQKIIEAARLLFRTKGFDNTTLSDIAEKLGISHQVVISHFTSLDEILEVVWSES